jgi:uncharacterized membrane protein YbjE (DUF340 family)
MLNYIIALAVGAVAGFFLPAGFMQRSKNILFNASLLALLFFMGVNLGKDPELLNKLSNFGLISAIMGVFVVFFSILTVFILIRLFGGEK